MSKERWSELFAKHGVHLSEEQAGALDVAQQDLYDMVDKLIPTIYEVADMINALGIAFRSAVGNYIEVDGTIIEDELSISSGDMPQEVPEDIVHKNGGFGSNGHSD